MLAGRLFASYYAVTFGLERMMTTTDYIVFFGYMIALLALGAATARRAGSRLDFLRPHGGYKRIALRRDAS
jgi:hypothetical protein